MELLYADDLVLVAETEELLMEKLRKWKNGMELKGLRVNIGKTKVMRCQVGIGQAEESGKYPCGVCKQGVGDNSIKCVACHRWVHKRCSGISGILGYVADFRCRRCVDGLMSCLSTPTVSRYACLSTYKSLYTYIRLYVALYTH